MRIYVYICVCVCAFVFNIAVMSLTVLQCISANFSQVIVFFKMRYEVQIRSFIPFFVLIPTIKYYYSYLMIDYGRML